MGINGMRVYENGMSGIPRQNTIAPGTGERQTEGRVAGKKGKRKLC